MDDASINGTRNGNGSAKRGALSSDVNGASKEGGAPSPPTATVHLSDRDFKVVYVAPMKALAAEVTATFSQRLAPLGVKVRECTGDMQVRHPMRGAGTPLRRMSLQRRIGHV